ncbi:hypothetical protein K1719_039185 [Acacia pycnantha]|nr:hypothetical protein K1719_039185 [Acacia pycnantha]
MDSIQFMKELQDSMPLNVDFSLLFWLNSFWRKGESNDIKRSRFPKYDHHHKKSKFPEFLKEIKHDVFMASERHNWLSPTSLEELQGLLEPR